jgi:glutamate formiminotransferase / formiminotetrahydrofolate cyclodeaminase
MSQPIVECIPNFSEARRPAVIDSIRQAISSVASVYVLDQHSDQDHNRTVITFAGTPQGVEEAAFRAIATAARLINLDEHSGAHPRIGATDVVPFVPISGVSMQECVEIAQRLGRRVGGELDIPVYLYEEAASRPDRQNLETHRRGQYEGLKVEIETNVERAPDFGPCHLGPAGATVIGARHPLIAYNIYLDTADVSIAKKIARAVRYSSGGLRYVKALGLLVDGRAQVSMNLTNYHATPLARVIELVRREAERYGVEIHHSELVGLIPEDALVEAAIWYTQLDQFEPGQILERRLSQALSGTEATLPVPSFLDALAAGTPTPGGGSAAAYCGAAGAALVAMVARLTLGRKKYLAVEEQMGSVLEQAEALRSDLTAAVDKDAAAYQALLTAYRLPKESPVEAGLRAQAIQAATLVAAQVPLQVAGACVEILDLAGQVVEHGNINAISDAGSAAALAQAGLTCAGLNVRTNLVSFEDGETAASYQSELAQLESRAALAQEKIQSLLANRGGITPS